MKHPITILSAFLLTGTSAFAGENHTLFNPTPDDQLRPMTTERPSRTDSPYSLDAGRIQLEMNLYGFIRNDDCTSGGCTKTRQHDIGGGTTIRIGLTDRMDIQFIGNLYQHQHVKNRTSSTETTRQGYGDTTVRLKINAVGNNPTDAFSLGVLPYIKLPSNQDDLGNNEVEGGLGLPFNFALGDGWNIGGMTQFNLVADAGRSGYDPAYTNSIIIGKGLTDRLSAYGEFYSYKADQRGERWENTLDFGTVYAVNDHMSVDANIQFGVSDAADDTNFYIGTAYRF